MLKKFLIVALTINVMFAELIVTDIVNIKENNKLEDYDLRVSFLMNNENCFIELHKIKSMYVSDNYNCIKDDNSIYNSEEVNAMKYKQLFYLMDKKNTVFVSNYDKLDDKLDDLGNYTIFKKTIHKKSDPVKMKALYEKIKKRYANERKDNNEA